MRRAAPSPRVELVDDSSLYFIVQSFLSSLECDETVLRPLLTSVPHRHVDHVGSPFEQALLQDTCDGSPWIRRVTFAAQAPDLPMRMNEDGFVMIGSLTCPHRPCIRFLFVASQL